MFMSLNLPGYNEIDLSFPINSIGKKLSSIDPTYFHIATEGPMGIAARRWIKKNGYAFTRIFFITSTDLNLFLECFYGF